MTLLDDMRALADEWENYECECDNPNLGPYCLYRWGVHDFGRELRLLLDATVEA